MPPRNWALSSLTLSPIILQRRWVLIDTSTFRSQTYNIPLYSYSLSYVIITLTPWLSPFSFLLIKSYCWYKAQQSYYPIWMLFHQCSPHWFIALLILYVYTNPVHILVIIFTQPPILTSIQHIFIEHILWITKIYKNFWLNIELSPTFEKNRLWRWKICNLELTININCKKGFNHCIEEWETGQWKRSLEVKFWEKQNKA